MPERGQALELERRFQTNKITKETLRAFDSFELNTLLSVS
jgi:hypothetical protein